MHILEWKNSEHPTVIRSGVTKTMNQINEILANPREWFQNDIDHLLTRVLAVSTRKITPDAADQKLVFDGVCHFLNTAFINIDVKKFYNTAPNVSLELYDQLSFGEKIVHTIYGKDRKLFYHDIVTGANCHHWTIILDSLFDKLQKAGLQINKRIVLYSVVEWHSFLLIEFQGKQYIADVFGESGRIGNIVSPVDKLRTLSQSPLAEKFSFQKKYDKDKTIQYFDTRAEFVSHLSQKPSNNIKLLFKPKIDGVEYNEVEIVISDESILCVVGEKSYVLFVEKWLAIPKKLSKTQVIDYVLQHATGDKKSKQEINTYMAMVRKKINPQKLYEIFGEK